MHMFVKLKVGCYRGRHLRQPLFQSSSRLVHEPVCLATTSNRGMQSNQRRRGKSNSGQRDVIPHGDLIWVHKRFPQDKNGVQLSNVILGSAWRMRKRRTTGPLVILRAVDLIPVVSALSSLILAQESLKQTDPGSSLAFTVSSVAVDETVSRMLPDKMTDEEDPARRHLNEEDRLLIDFSVYQTPLSGFTRGMEKHLDILKGVRHVLSPPKASSAINFALDCEKSLRAHGYARVEISASDLKMARNEDERGQLVELVTQGLLLLSQRLQDRFGKPMFAIVPDSSIRLNEINGDPRVNRYCSLHLIPCSDQSTSPPLTGHDLLILNEPQAALVKWHQEQRGLLDAHLEAALSVKPWEGFPLAPVDTWDEDDDKGIEIIMPKPKADFSRAAVSSQPSELLQSDPIGIPPLPFSSNDGAETEADGYATSSLRRYIIAAENCQVKSAASAIVRELMDNGQCLILAEAGMDISSALKVISEARSKIRSSNQGGISSELLFKVRCYPDLEDSPFFESFPALFALAFHLVRVPAEAVSNHLAVISSDPSSTSSSSSSSSSSFIEASDDDDDNDATENLIQVSASNYLKVNSIKEEDEEEGEAPRRGDKNEGYGGSYTQASSLAAAADRDRPLHLQQRLAQRALVELAAHSVVHLASVSSSSRIAAVRTAAIMTDALCCGSPPQVEDSKDGSLLSPSSPSSGRGGDHLTLSGSLAALRGLEALVLMRDIDRLQPDGFRIPVTTFTVMIGAGLDPGLAREQSRRLKGELTGPKEDEWGAAPLEEGQEGGEDIVDLCLIDSRNLF